MEFLNCAVIQGKAEPLTAKIYSILGVMTSYIEKGIKQNSENRRQITKDLMEVYITVTNDVTTGKLGNLKILKAQITSLLKTDPNKIPALYMKIKDNLTTIAKHKCPVISSVPIEEFALILFNPLVFQIAKTPDSRFALHYRSQNGDNLSYITINLNHLPVTMTEGFKQQWHLSLIRTVIQKKFPDMVFLDLYEEYKSPAQLFVYYHIHTDPVIAQWSAGIKDVSFFTTEDSHHVRALFPFSPRAFEMFSSVKTFVQDMLTTLAQNHENTQNPGIRYLPNVRVLTCVENSTRTAPVIFSEIEAVYWNHLEPATNAKDTPGIKASNGASIFL